MATDFLDRVHVSHWPKPKWCRRCSSIGRYRFLDVIGATNEPSVGRISYFRDKNFVEDMASRAGVVVIRLSTLLMAFSRVYIRRSINQQHFQSVIEP